MSTAVRWFGWTILMLGVLASGCGPLSAKNRRPPDSSTVASTSRVPDEKTTDDNERQCRQRLVTRCLAAICAGRNYYQRYHQWLFVRTEDGTFRMLQGRR